MRYFLRPHRLPPVRRVLLIESGSRELIETLLPLLPGIFGQPVQTDLVTCFAGLPKGFANGTVYRTGDYPNPASRALLYRELRGNGYQVTGMICSGEPIMEKWKWALAWRVPAKVFLLNENGDYVWMDREHVPVLWEFLRFRIGLAGPGAARTMARLALLPFSYLYLAGFAAAVHLRRRLRLMA